MTTDDIRKHLLACNSNVDKAKNMYTAIILDLCKNIEDLSKEAEKLRIEPKPEKTEQ